MPPAATPPHPPPLWASFAASACAACGACLVTNVPEVIKTRLQLDGEGGRSGLPRQYNGILHAGRTILRQEGIRGLQSGLSGALAYQVAMNGSRLGFYEPVQRMLVSLTGIEDKSSVALKASSGALSGAIGATLGSPLYLIKSRLQAQSPYFKVREAHAYSGLWDGLRKVHAAEGVRGLLRGVDGALPRVMTGSAVQLSSYDSCNALALSWGVASGFPQHLVSSMLASVLTVTAMNPFDVVSTRLYQSQGHATVYAGPLDCAIQTVRAEGWGALQKGWLAQLSRLGPHTVLTFLLLEQIKATFF